MSPNNRLVAYAEDTKGNEIYSLHIVDAETREPIEKPLVGVTSCVEWAGDGALVYVTMDEILRPDKVSFLKLICFSSFNKTGSFSCVQFCSYVPVRTQACVVDMTILVRDDKPCCDDFPLFSKDTLVLQELF